MNQALRDKLTKTIESSNCSKIEELLASHDELRESLNDSTQKPPLAFARNIDTARFLMEKGAKAEPVGTWWGPGFGNHLVDKNVGKFLVEKGAELTAFAAAGLEMTDYLSDLIAKDPEVVHAGGGDGGTPLHFAGDIELVEFFLSKGADVHEQTAKLSTPLHIAAWEGCDSNILDLLWQNGAGEDLELKNKFGFTPLELAEMAGHEKTSEHLHKLAGREIKE